MPKQKSESRINKKGRNVFYYEILGIILCFLSLFAIAKLGKLGTYLSLIVKLFFGDWYYLFIFLHLGIGIYFLLMHKRLPVNSMAFIGYLLLFLALITLSHFVMHDFISNKSKNYVSTTISLYVNYFKKASASSLVGGGIIGMLFFYLFYYLLAKPGVIIICLCFIVIGICFILKKTLIDIIDLFVSITKKGCLLIRKGFSKMQSGFNSISNEYSNSLNMKIFNDFCINTTSFEKILDNAKKEEIEKSISRALRDISTFNYTLSSLVTPHLIVFTIHSFLTINIEKLERVLSRLVNSPFLIRIDDVNNNVILEFINTFGFNTNLCNAIDVIKKESKDELFIAYDDHYEPVMLSKEVNSLLMFSKDINQYLFYLLECCIINSKRRFRDIILLDLDETLLNMQKYVKEYHKEEEYLDTLIEGITDNLFPVKTALFINFNTNMKGVSSILNKITQIIQYYKQYDCLFIVRMDDYHSYNGIFYDEFKILINYDLLNHDVNKIFGFNSYIGLNNTLEGLLKDEDMVIRISKVKVLDEEINKLIA